MAAARHFREHYLAELAYNELRDTTIAIIRPYLAQAQANEAPFEIRVDGQGHTTIVRLEEEMLSSQPFSWFHRVFVALLIFAALTSGALALFL